MDKLDTALLELLEEDARRTPEQVGVLLGISSAEAKARIEGLEAAGVIRGYTVLIDREQMAEETISALIEVKVQPERNRGFDAIAEQLY
ncbi:MAG: Lrp/AsnC family transcriptional regulator, partial [Clostridia bacterium]|nr:Lrp/AsnC family transcriptional regulator [Clostridia bacterium]